MRLRRIAISAAFTAGLAALPLSAAKAQYYAPYYPACSPFPLAWPFCIAVVVGAATIVTAPFWLLAGAPPPYYGYYRPPYYPPPGYYARDITHQEITRRRIRPGNTDRPHRAALAITISQPAPASSVSP